MNNLPRNITPEYNLTLPLSGKKIRIRPFLVKEEKVLLTAMESFNSGDKNALSDAVIQVVQNCILTKEIKANELPILDVETIFLELRKKSVGEIVEILIPHKKNGCGHENRVKVNLNDVKVFTDPKHSKVIKLTDKFGVTLKYPTFETSLEGLNDKANISKLYDLIVDTIDTIYDGETVTPSKEYTKADLLNWLETFTTDQMKSVMEFFSTIPYYSTMVKYKCEKCGDEEEFEIKGTSSFFT